MVGLGSPWHKHVQEYREGSCDIGSMELQQLCLLLVMWKVFSITDLGFKLCLDACELREKQIDLIRADKTAECETQDTFDTIRNGLMALRQNVVLLRDAEHPDQFFPVRSSAVPYTSALSFSAADVIASIMPVCKCGGDDRCGSTRNCREADDGGRITLLQIWF